ncbi:MAG: hypothetical protein K2Z81_16200, partial [Cyanobacteria bacterium]|nr:hypothetical protein [Cyanobacteriota bacterium]
GNDAGTVVEVGQIQMADAQRTEPFRRMLSETVAHLRRGNFRDAYNQVRDARIHPGDVQVMPRNHVLDISTVDPATAGDRAGTNLRDHLRRIGLAASAYLVEEPRPGRRMEFSIVEPVTVLRLSSGAQVDIMRPTQTINGQRLTEPRDISEVERFLASEAGRAIQERHAIIIAEEFAHVHQISHGNRAISREFSNFTGTAGRTVNVPEGSPRQDHVNWVNGEREIPFLLMEAGMSLEDAVRHFGHHGERTGVFEYLRTNNAQPGADPAARPTERPQETERRPNEPGENRAQEPNARALEARFIELLRARLAQQFPGRTMGSLGAAEIQIGAQLLVNQLNTAIGGELAVGSGNDTGTTEVLGQRLSGAELTELAQASSRILREMQAASGANPEARALLERVRTGLNPPPQAGAAPREVPLPQMPSDRDLVLLGGGRTITEQTDSGVRVRTDGFGEEWSRDRLPTPEEIRTAIQDRIRQMEEDIRRREQNRESVRPEERALLETLREVERAGTRHGYEGIRTGSGALLSRTRAGVGTALGVGIIITAALGWYIRTQNSGNRPRGLEALQIPGC